MGVGIKRGMTWKMADAANLLLQARSFTPLKGSLAHRMMPRLVYVSLK